MKREFQRLRTTVKFILTHALSFDWSLQGLGMLRLYMGDDTRLHVWDLRHAFPGASPMHDHQQWALHSTIVSGTLMNRRFIEHHEGADYLYQTMKAGFGCQILHEPRPIKLKLNSEEIYESGDCYHQQPEEIHCTWPVDGTVTVMKKTPTENSDIARVFWPANEKWGSAEPRKATKDEVLAMTTYALSIWQ